MLISAKQQEANQKNAQQSTGPKTPEGKEAIRFNALTYGLRTRCHLIPFEDPAELVQLGEEFAAEWQPQTRTERSYVETMVTSYWLLKRVSKSEQKIHLEIKFGPLQFKMLESAAKLRAQLERSFRTAVADMKQSQKERKAQPVQTPSLQPLAPSTGERSAPSYVMSETAQIQPVFCAATPDSR